MRCVGVRCVGVRWVGVRWVGVKVISTMLTLKAVPLALHLTCSFLHSAHFNLHFQLNSSSELRLQQNLHLLPALTRSHCNAYTNSQTTVVVQSKKKKKKKTWSTACFILYNTVPVQHFGKCFLLAVMLQQRRCSTEDRSMAQHTAARPFLASPLFLQDTNINFCFFAHSFYKCSFTSLFSLKMRRP